MLELKKDKKNLIIKGYGKGGGGVKFFCRFRVFKLFFLELELLFFFDKFFYEIYDFE